MSDITNLIQKSAVKNEIKHSFDEYKTITKEHLYKYLTSNILQQAKIKKNYVRFILSNEEIFNDIVETVILADWTHDTTRSSQRYWRTKCIIYAISNLNRKKDVPSEPLEQDIISYQTPYLEAIRKERAAHIGYAMLSLNKRERQIVKYRFYRQFPEYQIAKKFNISQTRVRQLLSNIRYKLAPKLEDLV